MSDRVHHEPIRRESKVVAFEIALTIGQVYLACVCLLLALQAGQLGIASIVLGALGVAALGGYGLWLLGGPGTVMMLANVPLLVLSVFALLLSFQPGTAGVAGTIVRSDAVGLVLQLVAVAAASLGIVAGAFLPGPRRRRWHHELRPAPGSHPLREPEPGMLAERLRATIARLRASFGTRRAAAAARSVAGRDQLRQDDGGEVDQDGPSELREVVASGPTDATATEVADESGDPPDDDAPYRPRR